MYDGAPVREFVCLRRDDVCTCVCEGFRDFCISLGMHLVKLQTHYLLIH